MQEPARCAYVTQPLWRRRARSGTQRESKAYPNCGTEVALIELHCQCRYEDVVNIEPGVVRHDDSGSLVAGPQNTVALLDRCARISWTPRASMPGSTGFRRTAYPPYLRCLPRKGREVPTTSIGNVCQKLRQNSAVSSGQRIAASTGKSIFEGQTSRGFRTLEMYFLDILRDAQD